MSEFKDLIKKRRSVYEVGKDTDLSPEEIHEYIQEVVKEVPTAFNSQSTRVVIVTGAANEAVWDEIHRAQKEALDKDMYDFMAPRFENSKKALGTVLFFEDQEEVQKMPTNEVRANLYKEQNSAFAQYAVWLALTDLDLYATLQHFNIGYKENYDKSIREMLNLPDSFELNAEMPFGSKASEANKKAYMDVDEQTRLIKEID